MNFIDYYFNPLNKIQGEDLRMYGYWELNFIPIYFYFEKNIPNLEKKIFLYSKKILDNPKSKLRIRPLSDATFEYDTRPTLDLVNIFMNYIEDFDDLKIEKLAIKSGIGAIFCYNKNSLCFCGNHQFLDGINMYNIMKELFDNDHIIKIPNFYYYPIITELMILPSIRKLINNYKSNLEYYPSWKIKGSRTRSIDFQIELKKIKKFKKKLKGLAFISCTTAFIVKGIFDTTKTNSLSVGILSAFESDKRFNNYGVIIIEIDRKKNTSLIELTKYINDLILFKKDLALTNYVIRNVYNSDFSFGNFDVLMSGFPMTTNKEISINNIKLKKTRQLLNYHVQPVYCMFLSCTRYINFTISIRCPDINENILKENLISISFN
jgi:hypothetical protein